MRKVFALVALVAAVAAISVTAAYAVPLHNPDSCDGAGTYHFVLNQAPDAASQTLTVNGVNFGTSSFIVGNGKVAHWTIELAGPLTGASTSGTVGMLVLSDFSCKKGGSPKK